MDDCSDCLPTFASSATVTLTAEEANWLLGDSQFRINTGGVGSVLSTHHHHLQSLFDKLKAAADG